MAEARIDSSGLELKDRVVAINRVAKVVKGGRRFSFTALVVVGDGGGHVGVGLGKAHEVPEAIRKAVEHAKKDLLYVPLQDTTLPCEITGHYGSGRVFLRPATQGTGGIVLSRSVSTFATYFHSFLDTRIVLSIARLMSTGIFSTGPG